MIYVSNKMDIVHGCIIPQIDLNTDIWRPDSMAVWSAENKITSTFNIYTLEVRILQNELKVENVQLRIWASSNLKLMTFTLS